MPHLIIPKSLSRYASQATQLRLDCQQLAHFDECLQQTYPLLYAQLYSHRQLKNFACLYVNKQLVRYHTSSTLTLDANDYIEIVIAIAGG